MRLGALVLFSGLSSMVAIGCSGATEPGAGGADDGSEETVGDSQEALKVQGPHYAIESAKLTWNPGCGIQISCAHPSLGLSFKLKDKGLHWSARVSINNTQHTLKVTVDTWTNFVLASKTFPTEIEKDLGKPAKLQIGETYDASVEDFKGNVLWSGEIRPMMGM